MAATFACNKIGLGHFATRVLLLPLIIALLTIYYSYSSPLQSRVFLQTGGLMFNVLVLFYIAGIATTVLLFPGFRGRYYEEKREGLYGGAMFHTSYTLLTLPLSLVSTLITIGILMPILDLELTSWAYAAGTLWASFVAAEQSTVAAMMIIKRPMTVAILILYMALVSLVIASGALRSFRNLPEWLAFVTNAMPMRYASLALNQVTLDVPATDNLPYNESIPCPGIDELCRYPKGRSYLIERFLREGDNRQEVLNVDLNVLITLAFSLALIIFNSVLYLLPLPARVKAKFRK